MLLLSLLTLSWQLSLRSLPFLLTLSLLTPLAYLIATLYLSPPKPFKTTLPNGLQVWALSNIDTNSVYRGEPTHA